MMEGAGGEMVMPKLVIYKNGKVADEIELTGEPEVTIGRDPESDISLTDPSVSRRHALLRYLYSEYFVEDLASTNGTQLNNQMVNKHILKSGDHLLSFGSVDRESFLTEYGLAGLHARGSIFQVERVRSTYVHHVDVRICRECFVGSMGAGDAKFNGKSISGRLIARTDRRQFCLGQ